MRHPGLRRDDGKNQMPQVGLSTAMTDARRIDIGHLLESPGSA
jgi:hypothetical protein